MLFGAAALAAATVAGGREGMSAEQNLHLFFCRIDV